MSSDPLRRGHFFLERRDFGRALEEARRMSADFPGNPEVTVIEAQALSGLGRHEEAAEAAERLVAEAPSYWLAHAVHAGVLRAASRFDAALVAADAARDAAPDRPEAWTEKAASHLGCEQFAAALAAAGHALALEPESRDAQLMRGHALLALNRRHDAEAAFRSILARRPDDADAHAGLAQTDLLGFRFDRAAEGIRNSLLIDADDEHSRELYLQTVRARTPVGRIVYGWSIFLLRFPRWAQFALIAGLYVTVQVLVRGPGSEVLPTALIVVIVVAYVLFCILTWFGRPIIDLYLKMNPETRRLVEEMRER